MQDLWLPSDEASERYAIGAVLVNDRLQAVRACKVLTGKMFIDEYHGWLWDRLRWCCKIERWDSIAEWLDEDGCFETAKRYGGNLPADLSRMMRQTWGGNLHWYVSRVRRLHERRIAIMDAAATYRRVTAAAKGDV